MSKIQSIFGIVLVGAALVFFSSVACAQLPSGVALRPNDPLNRDTTRPDRSEYEVRTTITGTPSQVEMLLKYAKEAFEAKPSRYADAEKYYLEAARLNPKEHRAYLGLGVVYAGQDRVKEAITSFQKVIELQPRFPDAHFNLGVIFIAIGKKNEAVEQWTTLKELDKKLGIKLKEMIDERFKAGSP